MMSITSTTTRFVSRRLCANNARTIISPTTSSSSSRCLLSTHCQEAVERLKGALEEYRVHNYQQELPARFKKEIIKGCSLTTTTAGTSTHTHKNNIAVEELEQLLRNIGAFGNRVTHDDVEIIVSEHCPQASAAAASEEMHADKI
eukprot:CAMPEP_0170885278 /NCGR_PEP_ID=MMETSP0734-20130129/35732_1 /TAXON_ID=186038 /ORGANISM="Fragilariopsis kerguelensis, Strain L26-C5" /LENGTH=144 /DNA_ID=CAMNT_0011270555 /DNA_START=101 /DNA_END=532 /DNA_ORIENTATION=-